MDFSGENQRWRWSGVKEFWAGIEEETRGLVKWRLEQCLPAAAGKSRRTWAAVAMISSIVQHHPEYNLAYLNMAWVLYKMGKFDEATRALTTYEQRQPPDSPDTGPKRLQSLLDSVAAATPRP